jgi:hypothetical protein
MSIKPLQKEESKTEKTPTKPIYQEEQATPPPQPLLDSEALISQNKANKKILLELSEIKQMMLRLEHSSKKNSDP